jgi:hypothetical protein
MRRNPVQAVAGAVFGVSQPAVSRRWDLLRPVIKKAVAGFIPAPREVLGAGTALADGTITPTWDWKHIPDLFSGKEDMPGMNVQVAATLDRDVAAAGPLAVHGARHDAYAFEASGLKDILAGIHAAADLGHTGVKGIGVIPFRKPAGSGPDDSQTVFNIAFSKIRAAVERAIAHLKTWRMPSEEGGRFRPPVDKFEETLQAIIGLMFFRAYE